jgi:hypothetical protein
VEELATERTETMTTAFITLSRPVIPAFLIAIMNGEALESTLFWLMRWVSLYGTRRPTMAMARTSGRYVSISFGRAV